MSELKQNIIVLSANQFSFEDEKKNNELNEGCTVRYLLTEDFAITEDTRSLVKGYRPGKVTLPKDDYHNFAGLPALYEAGLTFSVNSKGDAVIKPVTFKHLSDLSISRVAPPKMNFSNKEAQ